LNNILNDPSVGPYVSLVEYHISDSYSTTWGTNRFSSFYGANSYPLVWFDGITSVLGAGSVAQAEAAYRAKITQRRAVATNVSITVTGVQQSGSTFIIRAHVCVEPGLTRSMRLYMAAVLDHYPTSPNYSRNTFRQATTTQDVTLSSGQCYLFTRTVTFDSISWAQPQNIRVLVWAQTPNATAPAEVFNSAVLTWPFGPDCNLNGIPDAQETDCNNNDVPDDCDITGGFSEDCNANGIPDECDIAGGTPDCNDNGIPDSCDIAGGTPDCNENDIPDSCDIASGFSQDANGNGIPDECELLVGDLNCDGTVDFGDINPFILALSNPGIYATTYPDCDIMNGDINGDSAVDFQDINPFINLLTK
jgi:hypothetical protein